MSLAALFNQECVAATLSSIKLALQKLAEPQNLFQFQLSGALVDAASGGLGSLAEFAGDYVQENADTIAFALLQATGEENALREALNTVYKYLSVAFLANNTLVFVIMKILAANIIEQLDRKRTRLDKLKDLLTQLYNALFLLSKGDPVYNAYLESLRSALKDLLLAKSKVANVKNTLRASNVYLSKTYSDAQQDVLRAQNKLRPSTGGNPFTTPFYEPGKTNVFNGSTGIDDAALFTSKALLSSAGIPTNREQLDHILAIPKITKNIILEMKDYSTLVFSTNGMLKSYIAGVNGLSTLLQDSLKKYALEHLDSIITQLTTLTGDMSQSLKGTPNPVKVTTLAFKWTAQTSFIISQMKLLPGTALSKIALPLADVAAFQASVNALKALNNASIGQAVLVATQSQEQAGDFEQRILTALLQANGAVATAKVGAPTLALIKSLIARTTLTVSRDTQIANILKEFIAHEVEGEAELNRLINSINDLMEKAGLDKALDLFRTGDYAKFFGLNAKSATYVGAALEAIALLKDCFDSEEKKQEITKVQRKLERDLDLLSLKLSFDFDLAIFKNIQLCLKNLNLTNLFNLQEFLCGIAESAGVGKIFQALDDAVSF